MADHAAAYSASSFWWTVGGDGFPAMALARRRMPDPFVFTGMLTGDFTSLVEPDAAEKRMRLPNS